MGKRRVMSKSNIDSLIEEGLQNIRQDRAMASTLLIDIMTHIKNDKHEHKEVGPVAAKYLETLQRSNEQLVKISTLVHKKTVSRDGLTDADRESLYDLIGEKD